MSGVNIGFENLISNVYSTVSRNVAIIPNGLERLWMILTVQSLSLLFLHC